MGESSRTHPLAHNMTSANSTAFEPLGNLSRLDDLVKQLLPDVCCYEGQASGARSALGGNAADHMAMILMLHSRSARNTFFSIMKGGLSDKNERKKKKTMLGTGGLLRTR